MKDRVNINRVETEIIDGYPTGNVYVGLTLEEYHQLEEDLDKLEQYKIIEEELGIELNILFKALKQGYVWGKTKKGIQKLNVGCITLENLKVVLSFNLADGGWHFHKNLHLKDYGVTWALTRKELEDEV